MLNIDPSGSEVATDVSPILLRQCANNIGLKSIADVNTKRFTQIGWWGRAVTNYLVSSPETINTKTLGNLVHSCMSGHREMKISSVECLVNLCESHITGFNIKDNLKPSFVNLFAGKTTVIACERYDYIYFGGHYNVSGIDTTVMMNFQNTKAIGVLFPHNINEIAYERNPNLEQLTIQFDNRQIPPQPANTLSNSFLKSNFFCQGWSEFFPAPEEGEVSQAIDVPQAYPVRGRNNSDDRMFFGLFHCKEETVMIIFLRE
jgi:hypothetical protein